MGSGVSRDVSLGLVFALVFCGAPSSVWADNFRVLKGKNEPVCRAYKKYLEFAASKPHWERELMCARKIPADFQEFSQPQWSEIDPRTPEHIKLAVDVLDNMTYGALSLLEQRKNATSESAAHSDKAAMDEVSIRFNYGHDSWRTATADIDNDGKQDNLLKYGRGRCVDYEPESRRYTVVLVVVDSSGAIPLQAKTEQVLRKTRFQAFQASGESFDLFQFYGKTFVDRWENEGERRGKRTDEKSLSVYLNQGGASTLVCKYAKK